MNLIWKSPAMVMLIPLCKTPKMPERTLSKSLTSMASGVSPASYSSKSSLTSEAAHAIAPKINGSWRRDATYAFYARAAVTIRAWVAMSEAASLTLMRFNLSSCVCICMPGRL